MGNVVQLPDAADRGSAILPGLIDRARARLAEARTSAEVLEARAAAKALLEYARVTKATREAQADCFLIIKYAEMRLVEEVRAARERGEVARDGGDRKSRISPRGSGTDPATLDELGISSQRFAEWSEVHDAGGKTTIKEAVQTALDQGRAPTHAGIQRAVKGDHHRTRFTGETEWYTPAQYIEAARTCLGSIDVDPATSLRAQATVRATRFFTRDDDGLRHEWRGRVWLNPPYAQPIIASFIDKLLVEVAAGRATEAILLTHNYTDTGWFHADRTVRRHLLHPRPDPVRRRLGRDRRTDARPVLLLLRPQSRPLPRVIRHLRVHPMTAAPGYNPLRWDCLRRGCFNLKRRPKIELFAECFPGRINFGDVDGIVEVGGNALLLEWKSEARELPTGQRILYERLTRTGMCSAMVVVGDAETMLVAATSIFDHGIRYPPHGYEPADLVCIKGRLAAWSRWAEQHPAIGLLR